MSREASLTAKAKMLPKSTSSPGLELDGKGKVIPVAKRTKDDRRKVANASAKKKKKQNKKS
jgi:hypothetical protein